LTRKSQGGKVEGNLFPVGAGAGGSNVCPHMRWAAGEAGCLRKWGLAPHSTRRWGNPPSTALQPEGTRG